MHVLVCGSAPTSASLGLQNFLPLELSSRPLFMRVLQNDAMLTMWRPSARYRPPPGLSQVLPLPTRGAILFVLRAVGRGYLDTDAEVLRLSAIHEEVEVHNIPLPQPSNDVADGEKEKSDQPRKKKQVRDAGLESGCDSPPPKRFNRLDSVCSPPPADGIR